MFRSSWQGASLVEIDSYGVLRHTYWQSRIATSTRGDFVTDQILLE